MPDAVFPSGEEFQVNTHTDQSQNQPSITGLSDGGFVVTWQSSGQDGSGGGIYGQSYSADGSAIGEEFQVNTYTDSTQGEPSVTGRSDGGFVVTWTSSGQDGSLSGIFGQSYAADGSTVGNEFQANTYTDSSQGEPSVTGLSDGGFVVTWVSNWQDGSNFGVFGQSYAADGSTRGHEFQVNTHTTSYQSGPSVTGLSDGGFVVTWTSEGQDGSLSGVYGQSYAANGNASSHEFQINTHTSGYQWRSSVTGLSDGGFVVTWESTGQDGQDGSGAGVFGQSYAADGSPSGEEFQVNTYTDSSQEFPSVTGLSDGGFVVTWQSSGQDGSSGGVFGQSYAADGSTIGEEFQVNTYTDGSQSRPSITGLSDGGFVVTWVSYGQDGGTYGVFGQRYALSNAAEDETTEGTPDDDVLSGSGGNDTIFGFEGNDQLDGGAGNDSLRGGDGADTIIGGAGDDFIFGGETDADLRDVIYGGDGNDSIEGGYGNDELRGDAGNDSIAGGFGADTVIGGAGDDVLTGSALGDAIFGGDGDDFINGGFGHDRLNGGAGADSFYHLGIFNHGSDWIQDYNAAEGDVLQWGGVAATAANFQINTADTDNAGADGVSESFVIYRPTGQIIWALVDGDAQAEINIQIGGDVFDLLG